MDKQLSIFQVDGYMIVDNKERSVTMETLTDNIEDAIKKARDKGLYWISRVCLSTGYKIGEIK